MKHSKRYKRAGIGVEIFCGNTLIASSPHICWNFCIDICPICGGFVETTGVSRDTDRVQELIPVKIGNQFLAQ